MTITAPLRRFVPLCLCLLLVAGLTQAQTNNVTLQFNGGGENNKLFIGQNNTLDISITNSDSLEAVTLGLEFGCDGCQFEFVRRYGEVPEFTDYFQQIKQLVRFEHPSFFYWSVKQVNTSKVPDSLLLGGVDISCRHPIPSNSEPTLLFSLQIFIPEDTHPADSAFHIDNIFFPPGGQWVFSTRDGKSIVPDFQGQPNKDDAPTAPAIYFDIAKPTK